MCAATGIKTVLLKGGWIKTKSQVPKMLPNHSQLALPKTT